MQVVGYSTVAHILFLLICRKEQERTLRLLVRVRVVQEAVILLDVRQLHHVIYTIRWKTVAQIAVTVCIGLIPQVHVRTAKLVIIVITVYAHLAQAILQHRQVLTK